MFKQLLNTIKAKVGKGSKDKQGNYYSPADDERLAERQTMMQSIQTLNPQGLKGKEQPNKAGGNTVYSGVLQPSFTERIKSILPSKKQVVKPMPKPLPVQKKIQPVARPTVTPTPTMRPSPTPIPGFGTTKRTPHTDLFIEKTIVPLAKKYDIPVSVAAGMYAGESRLGGLGAKRNNFYNINAVDSDVSKANSYATPEAGVEAYMKLVSGQYKLASGKVNSRYAPAYALRKDPKAMLKKIHELGYASRPDYADFIMSTPEYRKYSK